MTGEGFNVMPDEVSIRQETAQAELDIIKSEMHETSRRTGHIEFIGVLGGEGSKNWTGNISLQKRLDRGELESGEVNEALDFLSASYAPTRQGSFIRCIDGRIKTGYNDADVKSFARKLGPQVAGGTLLQGVTYRISLGNKDNSYSSADMRSDMVAASDKVKDLGFLPGDHVDDNNKPGKTGCGAIDGVEEHCENIGPATLPEVIAMTKGVLGDQFNRDHFDDNIVSFAWLMANKKAYMAEKTKILAELVEHNPEAAPALTGIHNEIAVIINLVKGQTLHTDHFASKTNGKIQAFNYDIWHTLDFAKERFPNDKEKQSKYVHGRMMLAVTALMGLTDGSLIVGVRRPAGDADIA